MSKTSRQHKFLMLYIILIFILFSSKIDLVCITKHMADKAKCVSLALSTRMRLQSDCQTGSLIQSNTVSEYR